MNRVMYRSLGDLWCSRRLRSKLVIALSCVSALLTAPGFGQIIVDPVPPEPEWWAAPPPVITTEDPSDSSPVTAGQAKWMVQRALEILDGEVSDDRRTCPITACWSGVGS